MSDMKDLELLFGESVVLGHVCDSAYLALEAQFMNEQAAAAAVDLRILQENGTEEHRKTLMMALEAESAEKEAGFIKKLKEAFAKLMDTISKFFDNLMSKIRKEGAKSGTTEITEDQADVIQAVKNIGKDIKTVCSKLASKDLAGAYEYINTETGWIKWYGIIVGATAAASAASAGHRMVKAKIEDLNETAETAKEGAKKMDDLAKKLQAVDTVVFFGNVLIDKLVDATQGARDKAKDAVSNSKVAGAVKSLGEKIDGNQVLSKVLNVLQTLAKSLRTIATWIAKIVLNPVGTAAEVVSKAPGAVKDLKAQIDQKKEDDEMSKYNVDFSSASLESIAGFRAMFMTESAEPEEVTTTSIIDDILAKFQSKE